jgi:hypothetical protein
MEILKTLSSFQHHHSYNNNNYIFELNKSIKYRSELKRVTLVVELGQLVIERNGESKQHSYCDIWKFKNDLISHFFVI